MSLRNVLLALGAVCVFAGIGLLIAWFGQVRNPPAVVETPVVAPPQQQSALVAARKIPSGTKLGEEDFKDAPPGEGHPGSLRRGEEKGFLGKPSRRDIAEGEPLMPDDFNPCKLSVERGYRAMSIPVDAPQSVGGLLVPGDYVDVLMTQKFEDKVTADPRRQWAGETVLRDVRVLATDQLVCPPSGVGAAFVNVNAAARTPTTVTLALKDRQAEVLMVAEKLGTSFKLALVQHLESAGAARSEDKKAKPVWASDVSPALTEIITPPLPPPPPQCIPDTGSTIESRVRCPPGDLSYYRPPVASAPGAPKPEPQGQWPGMRYAPAN